MFDVIREDVGQFAAQLTEGKTALLMSRIAITREQADRYDLPTAPPKKTDSRAGKFQGETVQCEALPPNTLNQIVRTEIEARLDLEAFNANAELEGEERRRIEEVLASLKFGATQT